MISWSFFASMANKKKIRDGLPFVIYEVVLDTVFVSRREYH